jgi:hypothetical protein
LRARAPGERARYWQLWVQKLRLGAAEGRFHACAVRRGRAREGQEEREREPRNPSPLSVRVWRPAQPPGGASTRHGARARANAHARHSPTPAAHSAPAVGGADAARRASVRRTKKRRGAPLPLALSLSLSRSRARSFAPLARARRLPARQRYSHADTHRPLVAAFLKVHAVDAQLVRRSVHGKVQEEARARHFSFLSFAPFLFFSALRVYVRVCMCMCVCSRRNVKELKVCVCVRVKREGRRT